MKFEQQPKPKKPQTDQEVYSKDNIEQKGDTLEKIGKDMIELGKEIEKHPPLKRLKEIAKKFGKDIMNLFSMIKKKEKETEAQKESDFEEMSLREKIRKAIRPTLAFGLAALNIYNISNTYLENNVEDKEEDKIETINSSASNDSNKKRLIIDGPITYNSEDYNEYFSVNDIFNKYEIDGSVIFFNGEEEDLQVFSKNVFKKTDLLDEILQENHYITEAEYNRNNEKQLDIVLEKWGPEVVDDMIEMTKNLIKELENKKSRTSRYLEYKKDLEFYEIIKQLNFDKEKIKHKLKEIDFYDHTNARIIENIDKEKLDSLIKEKYEKIVNLIQNNEGQYKYYDKSIFDDFETFKKYAEKDKTFKRNILTNNALNEQDIKHIKDYRNDATAVKNTKNFYMEKIKEGFELEIWEKKLAKLKIFEDLEFDIDKIQKHLEEEAFKEKYKEIKKNIDEIEIHRKKILEKYNSDKYLKRLAIEVGNEAKARKIQQERIKRVKSRSFYISNFSHSTDKNVHAHMGYTDGGYVALPNENSGESSTHEFSHLGDYGGENIPESTKNKLTENFSSENLLDYQKKALKYYKEPTEILARKSVLDHELEKIGVKKYEEDFTEEHYKKIKKLIDKGELNNNSEEFFRMFEKDALIMIMNTVAYQDAMEKGVPIEQGKIAEELVAKIMKVNELNKQGDTYYPPEFFVNDNTNVS